MTSGSRRALLVSGCAVGLLVAGCSSGASLSTYNEALTVVGDSALPCDTPRPMDLEHSDDRISAALKCDGPDGTWYLALLTAPPEDIYCGRGSAADVVTDGSTWMAYYSLNEPAWPVWLQPVDVQNALGGDVVSMTQLCAGRQAAAQTTAAASSPSPSTSSPQPTVEPSSSSPTTTSAASQTYAWLGESPLMDYMWQWNNTYRMLHGGNNVGGTEPLPPDWESEDGARAAKQVVPISYRYRHLVINLIDAAVAWSDAWIDAEYGRASQADVAKGQAEWEAAWEAVMDVGLVDKAARWCTGGLCDEYVVE